MEVITLKWAAEILGTEIPGEASGDILRISTDTRQDATGSLFFALKGENSDGHQYVKDAFAKGAIAAVVSEPMADADGPLLVVPDTLRALGDLAKAYRGLFKIPVVGITGSVGKTSTREMLAAVLCTRFNVLASEKNFNNEIGVPLTLFQIDKTHEIALIEMGMRGLGEIDRLAEIAQPNIGLITNIGFAHIERLGSQENIAQAKAELFARLPDNGVAIVPMDSVYREQLLQAIPQDASIITFSTELDSNTDVRLLRVTEDGVYRIAMGEAACDLRLNAVGVHHFANALGVLAAAVSLGVNPDEAIAALVDWKGAEGRMVVRRTDDDITVLDDCYNAGPESMEAALATLREYHMPRIAVLGDMRELGDFATEAHHYIGRCVVETEVRLLVTVGDLAGEIGDEVSDYCFEIGQIAPEIYRYNTSDEAAQEINTLIKPTDGAILIKGSRAMTMEKIVTALAGKTGEETPHA